jgi:hypothetical protein
MTLPVLSDGPARHACRHARRRKFMSDQHAMPAWPCPQFMDAEALVRSSYVPLLAAAEVSCGRATNCRSGARRCTAPTLHGCMHAPPAYMHARHLTCMHAPCMHAPPAYMHARHLTCMHAPCMHAPPACSTSVSGTAQSRVCCGATQLQCHSAAVPLSCSATQLQCQPKVLLQLCLLRMALQVGDMMNTARGTCCRP